MQYWSNRKSCNSVSASCSQDHHFLNSVASERRHTVRRKTSLAIFLRRGELRLVSSQIPIPNFSQLRKAQFCTRMKELPALPLLLRLFPYQEMPSWLLSCETLLMRATCSYFWSLWGSPGRSVILLWQFSLTSFRFICKSVLWSSVSLDWTFPLGKVL